MLIDVSRLTRRLVRKRLPTGVDRVCLAYVQHYGPKAQAVLGIKGWLFVLSARHSCELFSWLQHPGSPWKVASIIFRGLLTNLAAKRVEKKLIFNAGHSGLESSGYINQLRRRNFRPIIMVHDLIPLSHPQYCRDSEGRKHLLRMRNATSASALLLCNSTMTLEQLQLLCRSQNWSLPRTEVVPLSSNQTRQRIVAQPMNRPYFVMVSTIEPRKNHLLLFRVWRDLAQQHGRETPILILIGQRGWMYEEIIVALESDPQLKPYVLELGQCSDTAMWGYLKYARALLYPSHAEGFGLPIIEALMNGVPVIASDLPVFREFADEVPEYLSPNDHQAWQTAVADYMLMDSERRNRQLRRLNRFIAPTWEDHFSKVDNILQSLAPN